MSKKQDDLSIGSTNLKNVVRISRKKANEAEEMKTIISSASAEAIVSGFPSTPILDLTFRKGNRISELSFVNFYVGNSESWNQADIKSIDFALAAAMSDRDLNNVMVQYFPADIASTFIRSQFIPGTHPKKFFKDDVENLVRRLYSDPSAKLHTYDLNNTVFNFMLPSGTMLTDASRTDANQAQEQLEEVSDSNNGLGGFHGLVEVQGNVTIYYAVGVYSETLPDQTDNGLVAFDRPWKNIVTTFYHELNEARTDPDVNHRALGWYSDGWKIGNATGGEIGDIPIDEAQALFQDFKAVFKEVPLTDGTGTVPIQFQYSNAVHGPEGPRPTPAPHSSE